MAITGFKDKFKHESIIWKVNGCVFYVLKLEFLLLNVLIHLTEVQNPPLFPRKIDEIGG